MKKIYSSPVARVVEMEAETLIAASGPEVYADVELTDEEEDFDPWSMVSDYNVWNDEW